MADEIEEICRRHGGRRVSLDDVVHEAWLLHGGVTAEDQARIAAGLGADTGKVADGVRREDDHNSRVVWEIVEKHGRRPGRLDEIVREAWEKLGQEVLFHSRQIADHVAGPENVTFALESHVRDLVMYHEQLPKRRSSRRTGRWLLAIGLLIAIPSLAFLGHAAYRYQLRLDSEGWPTASGVVLGSRVEKFESSDNSTTYDVFVKYEYQVAGRTYSSRTIGLGSTRGSGTSTDFGGEITPLFSGKEEKEARALAAEYPVKKRVKVYHHPSRPEICCLEPGDPRFLDFAMAILFPLAAGIGLAVGGAFMLVFSRDPAKPEPLAMRPAS